MEKSDIVFISREKINELLSMLSETAKMNNDSASDDDMKYIEEIRKIHPYAITPPPSNGGRWQTVYKDCLTGQKHNIKAQTEEDLLKKLIPVYFNEKKADRMTFEALYLEWLDYKKNITDSPNTILRHEQHFKKYFAGTTLSKRKLKSLTGIYLEEECNRLVKEEHLSNKEWVNVKTILMGMFKLAFKKKYLSENLMEGVEIHVKFRQVIKKTGRSQTYSPEELTALNAYLWSMYEKTGSDTFLAVMVNFYMGLRVGELVALKWTDFEAPYTFHIVREEIRNQRTQELSIADHTKTYSDRLVMVPPKALEILSKVKHESEFVFTENGERITARQVNYVLEKYAERNGFKTKSSHKMRKTYASNLAANGVPLDAIREQLGHTDLRTTLGYIYNPLSEKETYNLISKAL